LIKNPPTRKVGGFLYAEKSSLRLRGAIRIIIHILADAYADPGTLPRPKNMPPDGYGNPQTHKAAIADSVSKRMQRMAA
jgi:hypothetical protein